MNPRCHPFAASPAQCMLPVCNSSLNCCSLVDIPSPTCCAHSLLPGQPMSSGVRSWGTSLLSDGLIRAGRRYASMVGAEGGVVAQGGPTVPSGGGGGTVSSRRLQTATTPLAPAPQPELAPPADAVSTARPARRNRKSGEGASSSHATTWLEGEGEADPQDSLLFKHLHTHHSHRL